jgi:branched-chain amino acid transport system permease protein
MSLDIVVEALYFGAVYGLIALGFTLVFAPTRVLNFAQGEALVLGAAVAYETLTVRHWGLVPSVAVLVAASVVCGIISNYLIMWPVRRSGSPSAWIIATLAAALIFQSVLVLRSSGSGLLKPDAFAGGTLKLGSLSISGQQLLVFFGAIAVMIGYEQFLRRSVYGKAFRATAHDTDTSQLMGIGVGNITLISFVLSALVTAFAGYVASPLLSVQSGSGLEYTFKGFTAVVIGGLGSSRGALAGGLLIGLLDTLVRNQIDPKFGNIAVAGVLAAALLFFPSGFFGKPMEGH